MHMTDTYRLQGKATRSFVEAQVYTVLVTSTCLNTVESYQDLVRAYGQGEHTQTYRDYRGQLGAMRRQSGNVRSTIRLY